MIIKCYLTSFSRPARHLLRQVCLPPCRRSQGATAIVPRASRDQHSKAENGAKAAGGRKKRSSNAQLLRQIANVIDGICRSDSADRRHDTEATRSPLQSSDRSFAGMSASLTRMSADLAAMRADTADIQSVLDARSEELMRSSLAPEFGSRTVQPFIVSSLHSCLDYFGEQVGKMGIPRHEAIASIVSAVQAVSQCLAVPHGIAVLLHIPCGLLSFTHAHSVTGGAVDLHCHAGLMLTHHLHTVVHGLVCLVMQDKSLPAEMVTNVVSRMRRHLISINNEPSVPNDGMRMAQTALVAAKAALETAQDPTATTEDLCQVWQMHTKPRGTFCLIRACTIHGIHNPAQDEDSTVCARLNGNARH
jgi:hypothetical protein